MAPKGTPSSLQGRATGQHWTHVRRLAGDAVAAATSGSDVELQQAAMASEEALQERFNEAMEAQGDDEPREVANNTNDFAVELVARLIERTTHQPFDSPLSGRLALLYLTRVDWDLTLAVETAVANLDAGDEELIEDMGLDVERATGEQGESSSQAAGRAQMPQAAQPVLRLRPQTQPVTAEQVSPQHHLGT